MRESETRTPGCMRPPSFRSAFLLREGNGNGPAIGVANDGAGGGETEKRVAETFVANAELVTKLRAAERVRRGAERVDDAAIESTCGILVVRARSAGREGKMDRRVVVGDQLKRKRIGSRSRPMLDGEEQAVLLAPHMEERVGPGEEVSAAAERQAGLGAAPVFACMMHDKNGGVVLSLERAKVAKYCRDGLCIVLVDAVNAHEGIEDEEARGVSADGVSKARLITPAIEPEGGSRDDLDVGAREVDAARAADASEARLYGGRGVFGHVDQDGSLIR